MVMWTITFIRMVIMPKLFVLYGSLMAALFIAACSDNDASEGSGPESATGSLAALLGLDGGVDGGDGGVDGGETTSD